MLLSFKQLYLALVEQEKTKLAQEEERHAKTQLEKTQLQAQLADLKHKFTEASRLQGALKEAVAKRDGLAAQVAALEHDLTQSKATLAHTGAKMAAEVELLWAVKLSHLQSHFDSEVDSHKCTQAQLSALLEQLGNRGQATLSQIKQLQEQLAENERKHKKDIARLEAQLFSFRVGAAGGGGGGGRGMSGPGSALRSRRGSVAGGLGDTGDHSESFAKIRAAAAQELNIFNTQLELEKQLTGVAAKPERELDKEQLKLAWQTSERELEEEQQRSLVARNIFADRMRQLTLERDHFQTLLTQAQEALAHNHATKERAKVVYQASQLLSKLTSWVGIKINHEDKVKREGVLCASVTKDSSA